MISLRHIILTAAVFASAGGGWGAETGRVERNVPVRMRDGVTLRADVYRPEGKGPFPVLVLRTPYGKHGGRPFDAFLTAGYIVVKQDARGRYESEGEYESLYSYGPHDASDGYDTVEWAAKLPGANGKVGTFGISYDAFLQWRLAALRPPALVAMAASSIPPRLTDLEGPGTIRPGRRLDWYYCGMSPNMRLRSGKPGPTTKEEARVLWNLGMEHRLMFFLPWLELPADVFENDTDEMMAWLRNPQLDPWKLLDACREITVPNINVVGWYDHCNDSIELYQGMRRDGRTEMARAGQRLIIGPWSHATHGKRKQGELDFGPEAEVDLNQIHVRWFDHWIKGTRELATQTPVRLFVMGANRWRDEPDWPLARARSQTFFLGSSGHANTPKGDGKISDQPGPAGTDQYVYDPRDPVPTLWTAAKFTIPADQRVLARREDILVYQSEPLAEPLEVTGYPEVVLQVACSTPDTDFFSRLIDVAPDGSARDVTMGMVRARYRHGLQKAALLTPGAVTEIKIRLRPTANEFQPGHRIRLDVTSSDFPNYDRNHNTAADQNADAQLVPAKISVHHGGNLPSRLILPVILGAATGSPANIRERVTAP